MKKRLLVVACCLTAVLTGCGEETQTESGLQVEAITVEKPEQTNESVETKAEEEKTEEQASNKESAGSITQEQALEAIKKYCFANDPDLESMMNSDDYTTYFETSTNDAGEIVVLYRSYTAAQIRYYINPTTGEVYVTELVPGIIDNEQKTDESFNIKDYMSK